MYVLVILIISCLTLTISIVPFSQKIATMQKCRPHCMVVECATLDAQGNIKWYPLINNKFHSLCNFDVTKPTKLIVHGFQSDNTTKMLAPLQEAYLKNFDCNVIFFNWLRSSHVDYARALMYCMRTVSGLIVNFVEYGIRHWNLKLNTITCIAHSIGPHICGHASRILKDTFGRPFRSIVALDAAGLGFEPPFTSIYATKKLDKSHADFVLCLHSNVFFAGTAGSYCTVDLFFNNGTYQPHCPYDIDCYHEAATVFYINALENRKCFKGRNERGDHIYLEEPSFMRQTKKIGSYKVLTEPLKPFCTEVK